MTQTRAARSKVTATTLGDGEAHSIRPDGCEAVEVIHVRVIE